MGTSDSCTKPHICMFSQTEAGTLAGSYWCMEEQPCMNYHSLGTPRALAAGSSLTLLFLLLPGTSGQLSDTYICSKTSILLRCLLLLLPKSCFSRKLAGHQELESVLSGGKFLWRSSNCRRQKAAHLSNLYYHMMLPS